MLATTLARVRESLPIMIGTAIYAFGLHYFVIPNQLMEGGLIGIALLLNYSLGLPPSMTTLVMNIPLYWIAWRMLGKQSMVYTAIGTLSLSLFLWVMEMAIDFQWIKPLEMDRDFILAALCSGVTLGAGLGLVFRSGGTTGGSDIIARLGYKLKGWSMGRFVFAFDVVVIASSLLYIPPVKVLYTLVAVYITSRMIDYVISGAYAAKAFLIISENAAALSEAIIRDLDRGATVIPATGAYSGRDKQMLYCVVYRGEARKLQNLVRAVDPQAFIVISDVHNVLGEGFKAE
jgi:uncharacterized membrane-anchored protein YitT (DUF2179 family)